MSVQDIFCHESYDSYDIYITECDSSSLLETFNFLLQGEKNNPMYIHSEYISHVQKHGMKDLWRERIGSWMFDVGSDYDLDQSMIACAIHYMDQYLSVQSIDKRTLQLLSITSLFVASKMHTSRSITIEEVRDLTADMFSIKEIYDMEKDLVHTLKWRLNPPTSFTFARDLLHMLQNDIQKDKSLWRKVTLILRYIHENYYFIGYKNSIIAMVAIQIASYKINPSSENIKIMLDSINLSNYDAQCCLRVLCNGPPSIQPEIICPLLNDMPDTVTDLLYKDSDKLDMLINLLSS